MVYFIGDLHFGHGNVSKFRTQFTNSEEHDNHIIDNWNKLITKRDVVYLLGDVALTLEGLEKVKLLKGTKHLILGNHDAEKKRKMHIKDYVDIFDSICGMTNYKEFWLSHEPMHPSELRGKLNIHGHTHNFIVDDNKYFNACCEKVGFTPISLEKIREEFKRREV